jgi:stress response protein SCP2
MNNAITKIGLNRAKLISVNPSNAKVSKRLKTIFIAELAGLGYRVDNPELFNNSVFDNFDQTISTLIEMKGGDVDYVPLFSNFSEVDYDEVLILTVGNLLSKGLFSNLSEILERHDGLSSSRRQTTEELENGIIDQSSRNSDSHAEFITLTFTIDTENDIRKYLANNLYAKSSIKEALKEDIQELINYYGLEFIDPSKVVFKEIKSYVMKYLWMKDDMVTLKRFYHTPTDLLRMFAAVTDTDISLTEKIKFPKLRRSDRKFILGCLESDSNLVENLNKYKGLWLQVARYVHPGEYKSKFKKTFKAFKILRNDKVVTFNGMIEKFINQKDFSATMELISTRPGIFGRKLHELLDVFGYDTLEHFKDIAYQLELKNLLVLERYFMTINESDFRTVINKNGKVIVFPNERKGNISTLAKVKLLMVIKNAIETNISTNVKSIYEDDTKVWISPELRNVIVPLSMRKQSDGLLNIARGTRTKFDKTKTLRLFNYWKQKGYTTDFDLSLIEFDKDMKYKGHVDYTDLSSDGIKHSGDITAAPNGASEFIDIDMTKLNPEVKFLAIQVYKYAGESFNQVDKSYAGWMTRDKVDVNRKTFDIKTVTNKFNMVGQGAYAIPMIVDIQHSEIVMVDLYMNGPDSCNNVAGAVNSISIVAKEVVNFVNTKPNMLELLTYQTSARNAILVDDRKEATVTYDINDMDRVDEILSELL